MISNKGGVIIQFRTVALGQIADIQTGPFGSQLHNEDYVSVGIPIVTVEHLGSRKFTTQNLPFVSEDDAKRLCKYSLKKGDIVFSRVGSVDRCSFVSEKEDGWLFSGRCLRVRSNDDVDSLFLYYFLNLESTKELIRNIAVGATMPSINTQLLSELQIKLPTLKDQHMIVSHLDCIDNLIECFSSINENLLQLLKLRFNQLLELSNDSMPLGSIADIQTGPFGSQLHQEDYVKDGTPLVSVENLGEFHLNRKHLPGITPEDCDRLSRYLMKEGDIIFSRVGYVDRSSYVSKVEDGWMFSGSCLRIRNNDPEYALYTYLFLNTVQSRETFKSIAVGATRPSINSSILSEFEIELPPKLEMKHFNEYASTLESIMTVNAKVIEELTVLRDYLLPKLMSGEIDVSTLEMPN